MTPLLVPDRLWPRNSDAPVNSGLRTVPSAETSEKCQSRLVFLTKDGPSTFEKMAERDFFVETDSMATEAAEWPSLRRRVAQTSQQHSQALTLQSHRAHSAGTSLCPG